MVPSLIVRCHHAFLAMRRFKYYAPWDAVAVKPRKIPDLKRRTQDDAGAKLTGHIRMAYGSQPEMAGMFSSPTTHQ